LSNKNSTTFIDSSNLITSVEGNKIWIALDLYVDNKFNDISSKILVKYDFSKYDPKIMVSPKFKAHTLERHLRCVLVLDKTQQFSLKMFCSNLL
jgi:hypothetical protein